MKPSTLCSLTILQFKVLAFATDPAASVEAALLAIALRNTAVRNRGVHATISWDATIFRARIVVIARDVLSTHAGSGLAGLTGDAGIVAATLLLEG